MQGPLTLPQTVFSKPQEETSTAMHYDCRIEPGVGYISLSMLFTYKSGFPFMYKIYPVRGLEIKDVRNYKKER